MAEKKTKCACEQTAKVKVPNKKEVQKLVKATAAAKDEYEKNVFGLFEAVVLRGEKFGKANRDKLAKSLCNLSDFLEKVKELGY